MAETVDASAATAPSPLQQNDGNPSIKAEVEQSEDNEAPQEQPSTDVTMRDVETEESNALLEAKIPAKKDASLREFLSKMDDHAPIIPDAVINYYLTLAGLPPPPATPLPLARLLALATQKFVADVAADAYQYSRIRSNASSQANPNANMPGMPATMPGIPGIGDKVDKSDKGKNASLGMQRSGFGSGGAAGSQGRTVLTMEDLGMALGEYGVNVRRGEFYR